MTRDVQINTYNKEGSYSGGFFKNTVTEENPWDKLSKVFKKYTHTIEYTASGGYVSSNYKISVYTKSSGHREFEYKKFTRKVNAVEVFFGANDNVNSKEPLILGFIYDSSSISSESGSKCKSDKCYYSWTALKRTSTSTGDITNVDSVKEKDLVTVLLEELGNRDSSLNRQNKVVIRVDEQPEHQSTYPGSGNNKDKITVKKETVTEVSGFYKYEHTVGTGAGSVEEFYVSYDNNSRYFKVADSSGYGYLQSVAVYFESTGDRKLVLITFTISSLSTHEYKYFDFVTELKKLNGSSVPKKLKELEVANPSNLKSRLEAERERLKESITFVNKDGENNENISEELGNVGEGTKFTKVTMKVNTDDAKGGSSVGPWKVSNKGLFTLEPGKKIDEGVLTSASITTSRGNTKYKTITIFYALTGDGGRDHKALLVEFDHGISGTKTYIKRTNKEGTTWVTYSISAVDESVLTSIGKAAGIIEGSNVARDVGIGLSVTGLSGAGVGFAIYKNLGAVSAFIGRLF